MTTVNLNPTDYWIDGEDIVDTKAPAVEIDKVWQTRQFQARPINPAGRRKLSVIIVDTGLASGAAAATFSEAGYNVLNFCYQDSPRWVHSIMAQGGISTARNYRNDNDSTYQLPYDTVKGGSYHAREINIYQLTEVSANIIGQCAAQGVPFAHKYGDPLDTRPFDGMQVQYTFYAHSQTGQQPLIDCYQQLERQIEAGTIKMYPRHEMVKLIVIDGRARGIVAHNIVNGKIEVWTVDAVILGTGSHDDMSFLPANAMGYNAAATWRVHRKDAYFGSPCYTQIYPIHIPMHGDTQPELALTSKLLRNDGHIWASRRTADCAKNPRDIPEEDRGYYLERIYPTFGNLAPRDITPRQAKNMCDEGRRVDPIMAEKQTDGTIKQARRDTYLGFSDAINWLGKDGVPNRYGNLFDMYRQITGENSYKVSMHIYPAVHHTMGRIWVNYDLQGTISGPYVTGEASFSDHGVDRLGASALMQGLVDGYFVLPNIINDYLADGPLERISDKHLAVVGVVQTATARFYKLLSIQGTCSVDSSHKGLGRIMWRYCGMNHTEEGLTETVSLIRELHGKYWRNVRVTGINEDFNQALERVGRTADLSELGGLMCIDTLHRRESCGSYFRVESQTEEGEVSHHDDEFPYVAAQEWTGEGNKPILHREPLVYKAIELKQRSYK